VSGERRQRIRAADAIFPDALASLSVAGVRSAVFSSCVADETMCGATRRCGRVDHCDTR
jgi:hypothetical protein